MTDTRAPAIDIALVGGVVGARDVAAGRTNIFDLDRASLERFFVEDLGEKTFRAQQVMKWIHHRHVTDFGEMTDLGKALRAKLEDRAVVHAPRVVLDKASEDGTHKWLLGMDASNAIETVFIPDKGRGTLCVSSQVGCALECTFCSTGRQGFNRNLSVAEIIGQLWWANRSLGRGVTAERPISNVRQNPFREFVVVLRKVALRDLIIWIQDFCWTRNPDTR